MDRADRDGFFARRGDLDPEAYIELDLTFECVGDPRDAAAHVASEQSTAQWRRVGTDEDLRPQFGAKVLEMESRPLPDGFSLPLASPPSGLPRASVDAGLARVSAPAGAVHACRAVIAHPHANFSARIPNLLSAVLGEGVFFAPGVPIVRLQDIRFPASFLASFEGPQFGVAGLRERLNVHGRPMFIGVVKPNVGLPADALADLAYRAWLGGLDIAKDDELVADAPWSPLDERVRALGAARERAERETGTPKLYLANITDEVDRILDAYDRAVIGGANAGERGANASMRGASAVMLNALPVGLSAVRMLRRHATVPVFTHFPMIAAMSRIPGHGVHSRVFTRLQRLAGSDAIVMPGFGERMMTPESEVLENVRACLEPMGALKPSLPVPGGSDSAATLAAVHRRLGTVDFGFICGRGIFAHADGPEGGARAIRAAWDAIAR